jgi:hypothetical protein
MKIGIIPALPVVENFFGVGWKKMKLVEVDHMHVSATHGRSLVPTSAPIRIPSGLSEENRMLKELLLSALLTQVPPGTTKYSVEPDGNGGFRQESAATGRARYEAISNAMVDAASELLCLDDDGKRLDGCKPADGAMLLGKRRWSRLELVETAAAASIYESGLREDVMNGRGQSKHPDANGGEGRGPGMEACNMQIHPAIAWRFADIDDNLRARAGRGEPGAREAVMQTLLGEANLKNCFKAGMRMLLRARAHCEWFDQYSPQGHGKPGKPSPYHWTFLTFSMYGTGDQCYSSNHSKTSLRASLAEQMIWHARRSSKNPPPR